LPANSSASRANTVNRSTSWCRGLLASSPAQLLDSPPQAWISRFSLSVEIQHILEILQSLFVSGLERHAQLKQLGRFETTGS